MYDSPCIDAGDPDTTQLTNDPNYTTRTDSYMDLRDPTTFVLADPNLLVAVDMGYHHSMFVPNDYSLNFYVFYNRFELPGFTAVGDPDDSFHVYKQYTQVELSVTPPPAGYEVEWTGTENVAIVAFGNDTIGTGGVKNGFVDGELVQWILWYASKGEEVEVLLQEAADAEAERNVNPKTSGLDTPKESKQSAKEE